MNIKRERLLFNEPLHFSHFIALEEWLKGIISSKLHNSQASPSLCLRNRLGCPDSAVLHQDHEKQHFL